MKHFTSLRSRTAACSITLFILFIVLVCICPAQTAVYDRAAKKIEVKLGKSLLTRADVQKIYLQGELDGGGALTSVFLPSQIRESGDPDNPSGHLWTMDVAAELARDLVLHPAQLDMLVKPDRSDPRISAVSVSILEKKPLMLATIGPDDIKTIYIAADSKDTPELKISGNVTTAVKSKPNWVAAIQFEHELKNPHFSLVIAPFFKLNYDSKPNKTDKLSFGINFKKPFWFKPPKPKFEDADAEFTRLLKSVRLPKGPYYAMLQRSRLQREYFEYIGSVEFESDLDFRVNNFITSQSFSYFFRPKLFSNNTPEEQRGIFFIPTAGAEFGVNLKNPVASTRHAIGRIKAGGELIIVTDNLFGRTLPESLVWDTTFIERWFIADEFIFNKGDDGKLMFKTFGRQPRAHFQTKLAFKLNKYFGPELSYEWGEVPPLYDRVNHKINIGFVYSFARKPKPKP